MHNKWWYRILSQNEFNSNDKHVENNWFVGTNYKSDIDHIDMQQLINLIVRKQCVLLGFSIGAFDWQLKKV